MPDLLHFQIGTRKIDIPKRIGVAYYNVGTVLLDDTSGSIMPQIEETFRGNIHRINIDILR